MSRIPADENISPILAQALRASGHDVRTVHDLALQGASDAQVLETANGENRALLTADKDFGLILELGPLAGRGKVVLLRYRLLDWTAMAQDLATALAASAAELDGPAAILIVVSEGQYRIRRWTRNP